MEGCGFGVAVVAGALVRDGGWVAEERLDPVPGWVQVDGGVGIVVVGEGALAAVAVGDFGTTVCP